MHLRIRLFLVLAALFSAACQAAQTRNSPDVPYQPDVPFDEQVSEWEVAEAVYALLGVTEDGKEGLRALESAVSRHRNMSVSRVRAFWRDGIEGLGTYAELAPLGCPEKALKWVIVETIRLVVVRIEAEGQTGIRSSTALADLQGDLWRNSVPSPKDAKCIRYSIFNMKAAAAMQR